MSGGYGGLGAKSRQLSSRVLLCNVQSEPRRTVMRNLRRKDDDGETNEQGNARPTRTPYSISE